MTDFATLAIKISTDGANRANNDLRSVERSSKQTEKAVDSLSLAINALKRLKMRYRLILLLFRLYRAGTKFRMNGHYLN